MNREAGTISWMADHDNYIWTYLWWVGSLCI